MKRSERSSRYRLLAAWRTLLANVNHLALNVDDPGELDAIARVKDYIIDQIAGCEASLITRNRLPENEQFAGSDNRLDNAGSSGVENG